MCPPLPNDPFNTAISLNGGKQRAQGLEHSYNITILFPLRWQESNFVTHQLLNNQTPVMIGMIGNI